jgi:hypothetical protein
VHVRYCATCGLQLLLQLREQGRVLCCQTRLELDHRLRQILVTPEQGWA